MSKTVVIALALLFLLCAICSVSGFLLLRFNPFNFEFLAPYDTRTDNDRGSNVTDIEAEDGRSNDASNPSNDSDDPDFGDFDGASGNTKPSQWPEEYPTLSGGTEFNYAKLGEDFYLSYTVKSSKSLRELHEAQLELLFDEGWESESDFFSGEAEDYALDTLVRGDAEMTVAATEVEGGVQFAMIGNL